MTRSASPRRAALRRSAITLAVVGGLIPAAAIAAPEPPSTPVAARSVAATSQASERELIDEIRQRPSTVKPRRAVAASRSTSVSRPAAQAPAAAASDAGKAREAGWETANAPVERSETVNRRGEAFASVAGQELVLPDGVVAVGFHESGDARALPMEPVGRSTANHNSGRVATPAASSAATEYFVLPTRQRANGGTTAVDIRVEPDTAVTAPVTGTVDRVSFYALYGRTRDVIIEIVPEDNPNLRVRLMHVQDVGLKTGTVVTAGESVVAERGRQLPFASQIDRFAGAGPHLHIEVHKNHLPVAEAEEPSTGEPSTDDLAEADETEDTDATRVALHDTDTTTQE